jgi:hypothetical protein
LLRKASWFLKWLGETIIQTITKSVRTEATTLISKLLEGLP